MILVFGGAYQGKLNYVLENFNLSKEQVFECEGMQVDYKKRVINGLEKYIYACNDAGIEALESLEKENLKDKIVICDDVSQGLVPLEKKDREYREMCGRTLIELAKEANEVIRVFCGIGTKIK